MPLQMESSAAGVPGAQVSTTAPLTQEVVPVEAQAPIPQDVGVETKSSSAVPLQSSSTPSHVTSSEAGVPGVQLSTTAPARQLVEPAEAQAPVPQLVGMER